MFVQDRDAARRYFIDVWQKYNKKQQLEPLEQLLLGVLLAHPEYHAMLDQGEESVRLDFSPDAGAINPFLHMGMHVAIHEQIQADRPPGISTLYRSLLEKFSDQHELEHRMMECLGEVLWTAQRNNTMPDESTYFEQLRKLK